MKKQKRQNKWKKIRANRKSDIKNKFLTHTRAKPSPANNWWRSPSVWFFDKKKFQRLTEYFFSPCFYQESLNSFIVPKVLWEILSDREIYSTCGFTKIIGSIQFSGITLEDTFSAFLYCLQELISSTNFKIFGKYEAWPESISRLVNCHF